MIFGSPRQALAYMLAHHRGPSLARPKYHDAPGDTGRSHWDGPMIGALLYGPRIPTEPGASPGCGVERGSDLDRAIQKWATTAYTDPPPEVLAVERRMRAIMHAQGMLRERRRVVSVRRWVDPDGAAWTRQVPQAASRAESCCATVGNLAKVP